MWPNPQFSEDLVTFTEESHNGKLCFLRNVNNAEEMFSKLRAREEMDFRSIRL